MKMKVLLFGQLADITGTRILEVENINDTDDLRQYLKEHYPDLTNNKFAIAVNKSIVREKTILNHTSTVALMPPFSGG